MESLLANKWVLYGGAAVLALVVGYSLFGGGGSASADDGEGSTTGTGMPLLLGGYGAPGAGSAGATGIVADNSVELLANLEKTKAEFGYNVSMADIAATMQLGLASLLTQEKVALDTNQTERTLAALDFSKTILNDKSVQTLSGTIDVGSYGSGLVAFDLAKVFKNDVKGKWTINNNTALFGGPGIVNNLSANRLEPSGYSVPNAMGINYGIPQSFTSVPVNPASAPVGTVNGYAGTSQAPYVPGVGQATNNAYAGQPSNSAPVSVSAPASYPSNTTVQSGRVSGKVTNTAKGANALV